MKYIIWRFSQGIASYWKIVARLSAFWTHIMGIRLLFRTLFWPWKRDLQISRKQGFDVKDWLGRHVFNLFSRFIGFFIKLFTILAWAAWEIVWLVGTVVLFPIWVLSPLVVIALLFNLFVETQNFASLQGDEMLFIVGSIILVLLLITIEVITFRARRISRLIEADLQKPNPDDLWFNSMCAHLLVDQTTLLEAWMNEKLKGILISSHLSRTEFDRITVWEINRQIEYAKEKCWWTKENLFEKRPLTEDWAFGWTFTLNNFSRNLNYRNDGTTTFINAKELEILKNSLAEGDGVNVVIVGEAGTGKKHLVQNLAMDLSRRNVPLRLAGKKILEFHLDNLIATSSTEEDKIYLLEKAFAEASAAGNIILYIPTIQNYLEANSEEKQIGQIDITPVLTNFLENSDIQIITCSNQQDLNVLFQRPSNLSKYFKIIQLSEPDPEDCLLLLAEKGSRLEFKYGKLISYSAIKKGF